MTSDPRQFPAFWQQLTERVRQTAERRGTSSEQELQQFVLQRVMARQFTANPDDWMIKGGQGMLARWPDARSTSDLDMVGISGASREEMVAKYTAALEQDLGDHLTFELEYDGQLLQHGEGARLKHKVYCGGRELGLVEVDLVPPNGRPLHEDPELVRFPEQIMSTGVEGEDPELRLISVTDTLAHKVSGMYTKGTRTEETKCAECLPRSQGAFVCQSGELPNRVQDMVDVLVIAEKRPQQAAAAQAVLQKEFRLRLDQGEPLRMTNQFFVPNPEWREGFRKYAASTPALPFKTIGEAEPTAKAFLNPLLNRTRTASGEWDPELRDWVAPTAQAGQQASPGQQQEKEAVLRVLVVAHASGRDTGLGGLPVASGGLTKALAGLDNVEVTLLTIGETEEHGEATVLSVPSQEGVSAREQLRLLATEGSPESVPGLPPANSDSFDLVVGHARFSGWPAMLIRDGWYPHAQFAHVLHMPAKEYAEVQGWPERGQQYHDIETATIQNSDLTIGVGKLLTDLGAEMADGSPVPPNFHELVPGVQTFGEIGDPPPNDKFTILFSGRVGDKIKGYDDLLATVKELHDRGEPVELLVRGVKPDLLAQQQQQADEFIGRPGVVKMLPYTTDQAELLGDYQAAHVAVMPSKIEGFGLAGIEPAAHGLPVLINAESGAGQLLTDSSRIPPELGAQSVVPDQGLRDDQPARVAVWSSALMDLRNNYDERRADAGELKGVLNHYSWTNTAQAVAQAARESTPGANVSTQQGPDGALQPVQRRPTIVAAKAVTPPGGGVAVAKEDVAKDDMSRFLQSGSPIAAQPKAADQSAAADNSTAGEADRTQRGTRGTNPGLDSGRS